MRLDPFRRVLGRVEGAGSEDGAFVGGIPIYSRELEISAGGKEGEGVVGYEIVVQGGVVCEERVAGGVREGGADVLRLKSIGAEFAKTGECVVVSCTGRVAFRAGDELVVLVLGFLDCAEGSEGLGLGGCGVEEAVVFSAVCGELEGYGGAASARATKNDVVGIAAELAVVRYRMLCSFHASHLADVLLNPA